MRTIGHDRPIGDLVTFLKEVQRLRGTWVERTDRPGEETALWFRGQSSEKWGLRPELYRKEFLDVDVEEREIRHEFQSQALQLIHGRLPQDKFDWYFLMRHYGAPTRLLDWSDNPLVALYFAVAEDGDDNPAVWVLDPWLYNSSLKRGIRGPVLPDWDEAKRYLYDLDVAFNRGGLTSVSLPAAIEPPHLDARVTAQGSKFLIFGRTHDLARTVWARRKNSRLVKVIVDGRRRTAFRRDLNLCGVNEAALFPDLGALCNQIRRRWRRNQAKT